MDMDDNGGGDESDFVAFFNQAEPGRGPFLAKLFATFSEDIVRFWSRCPNAPYEDLGRPTLRSPGTPSRGTTLDFTLRQRTTGDIFVAEMKCWLDYDKCRYLQLTSTAQIAGAVKADSSSKSFSTFLEFAQMPSAFDVDIPDRQNRKQVNCGGAILIWGSVTPQGRDSVMTEYGITEVLSAEQMLNELGAWQPLQWAEFMNQRRRWANDLFDFCFRLTPS